MTMNDSMTDELLAYPFNDSAGLEFATAYAAARATPGMVRVQPPYGEPAWLATRYADARKVLVDRRFSRARAAEHDEPRLSPINMSASIMTMDPPDHTRLRTLVGKAFTAGRIDRMRPRIREIVHELLDELRAGEQPVDLVEQFCLSLPVAVICELLGIPVTERPKFRVLSDAVLSTSRPAVDDFLVCLNEFRIYMIGLIDQRQSGSGDDLITGLVQARTEGDRLSEGELIDLCLAILVAGHEAISSELANFVYVLLREPGAWQMLGEHPERVPSVVEELLRFVPLSVGAIFARYATEDVEVGGVLVRAGEPVLVAMDAANRDERCYTDPERLRMDRSASPHLSFGLGPHRCLGAQLATVELQEAVRGMTAALPGLHLAGEVVWKNEMLVRGPRVMPVGW